MPNIKIDDQEFDLDSLPDTAKAQFLSLQFVDAELNRLAAQTAVFKTARIGYVNALKQAVASLPGVGHQAGSTSAAANAVSNDSGIIKFS
jgi:hypothetical protein